MAEGGAENAPKSRERASEIPTPAFLFLQAGPAEVIPGAEQIQACVTLYLIFELKNMWIE